MKDQPKPVNDPQADAGYRDYHDVPFPEGTQPAGQWTAERLISAIGWHPDGHLFERVAQDINAALAVEKRSHAMWEETAKKLDKQLAAEREKREREMADYETLCADLQTQLAAERGAKHHMEACRALLKVPDEEVLYEAIKQLAFENQRGRGGEKKIMAKNNKKMPPLPKPKPGRGKKANC